MLSFLSYRKNEDTDSETEDDEPAGRVPRSGIPMPPSDLPMPQNGVPMPRSGIPTRFAHLSVDTIDYAGDSAPDAIVNNLRPDEEIGLTEDSVKNGNKKTKNGATPKIVKSGGRSETISDKQKADNIYAANKTIAEGMMDIALLTSNANQLKFLLSYNTKSKAFYLNVTLIAFSLLLQVAVGVSLIVKKNLRGKRHSRTTHYINQFVVIGIFLVTVINVFVAAFTTADSS